MVSCHLGGILSNDQDDSFYIWGDKRVFITDSHVTFDPFEI